MWNLMYKNYETRKIYVKIGTKHNECITTSSFNVAISSG